MLEERSVLNRGWTQLNPVSYGYENCDPSHSFGYAMREYYLIHCVMDGKGSFTRAGVTYPLKKYDLFLIRPGELTYYQADDRDPWDYIWVGFCGEDCEALLEGTGFSGGGCTESSTQATRLFSQLREIPDQQPTTEYLLCSKLYELFACLMQPGTSSRSSASDYAARTADYIRANFIQPLKIEGIAAMLGIDRRYLCRVFSRQMGSTPQDFLIRTRMESAAQLLKTSGYSIAEVAKAVGYDDPFLFSKMFKRKYGVSPLHYRCN